MRKVLLFATLCTMALALVFASTTWADPWKFGVMADTQWTTTDPSGLNPTTVSKSIIDQINPRFIEAGVRFVIQVGDLADTGNDADETVRANAALPLIGAGIGFFPMRGNHETYGVPTGANGYAIPIFQTIYPQTRGISGTFGAKNFSSPTISPDLNGMSYSFDYKNARFVIIDPWATPSKIDNNADGYPYGYTINDQQPWISSRLDKRRRDTDHAFVFSHQPLIAESHQDTMFSGYTNANPAWQNAFYASLQNNNVKYFLAGHDHIHQRSIVASPDGKSSVQEIIGSSDSSKFYTPKLVTDPNWFGQKVRETSLSQERYTVGYYIYTVDGPRVTVDYYSDDHGNWASDNCYADGSTPQSCTVPGSHITPTFNFVKKETWGYSLNGKEFLVAQGQTYTSVQDAIPARSGFLGTTAKILSGTNGSTSKDWSGRALTKAVDTGWAPITEGPANAISDIFTLWGLGDVGSDTTDTYAVSVSFDPRTMRQGLPHTYLATKDAKGHWVKAASGTFVLGPFHPSYPLGTHGVDPKTKTAWAVVNQVGGDFAVMQNP